MISILQELNLGRNDEKIIKAVDVWEKLKSLYDLEGLDKLEDSDDEDDDDNDDEEEEEEKEDPVKIFDLPWSQFGEIMEAKAKDGRKSETATPEPSANDLSIKDEEEEEEEQEEGEEEEIEEQEGDEEEGENGGEDEGNGSVKDETEDEETNEEASEDEEDEGDEEGDEEKTEEESEEAEEEQSTTKKRGARTKAKGAASKKRRITQSPEGGRRLRTRAHDSDKPEPAASKPGRKSKASQQAATSTNPPKVMRTRAKSQPRRSTRKK